MGRKSFDVGRFDLEHLLQFQTRTVKLKSAYNSLIIGTYQLMSGVHGLTTNYKCSIPNRQQGAMSFIKYRLP